jgi:hypothetical protein
MRKERGKMKRSPEERDTQTHGNFFEIF